MQKSHKALLDERIKDSRTIELRDKSLIKFFIRDLEREFQAANIQIIYETGIKYYISYQLDHIDLIYDELTALAIKHSRPKTKSRLAINRSLIDSIISQNENSKVTHQPYTPFLNEAREFLDAIQRVLESWKENGKMPIDKIASSLIKAKALYSKSDSSDSQRQQYYIKKKKLASEIASLLRSKDSIEKWSDVRSRGLFDSLFTTHY